MGEGEEEEEEKEEEVEDAEEEETTRHTMSKESGDSRPHPPGWTMV
jgi:hypothetical protein